MRGFASFQVLMLFFLCSVSCLGQTQQFTARNSLFAEFGGASGMYAVNYGRVFRPKEKLKLNLNLGFSVWPNKIFDKKNWTPVVPIEFTAFYGKTKHHFELGVGYTSYADKWVEFDENYKELKEKTVYEAIALLRIGYRFQKPEGGFFYRIGYTPFFKAPSLGRDHWVFEPRFAAFSIGKSF